MRRSERSCRIVSDPIAPTRRADDTRRVVAALKACHGIPTILLEVGLVQRLIVNRVAELEFSLLRRGNPVQTRGNAYRRIVLTEFISKTSVPSNSPQTDPASPQKLAEPILSDKRGLRMFPDVARLGPVSECSIAETEPPANKQPSPHGPRQPRPRAAEREFRLKAQLLTFLAIACAAAATLSAQQGPEYDPDGLPGYVDSVFHHSNFDSVNLYNGQLTIPIALGPSYPVGPKLKYQATLIYTSKVDEFGHPDTDDPSFIYRNYIGDPALGLGWSLNTGAIKDCGGKQFRVLCYVGPGGAQHTFTSQPSTGWYKTKDGSQLLLHDLGTSGFEMWDGDGNKYSFTWQVTNFDDVITGSNIIYVRAFGKGRNGWYLTTLSDPHGNSYTVEYYENDPGPPAVNTNPCWEHMTPCPATKMNCPTATNLKSWIPKAIVLPTGTIDITLNTDNMIEIFKFPVVGGTKKNWTLAYSSVDQNVGCPGTTFKQIPLVFLDSITLPTDAGVTPKYAFQNNGLLSQLKLPTGATVDYSYATWWFWHGNFAALNSVCVARPPETNGCILRSGASSCLLLARAIPVCTPEEPIHQQFVDEQMGVVSRTETIPRDPGVSGTPTTSAQTLYHQYAFPFGETAATPPTSVGPQTLTVVVYPPTDVAFNGAGTPTSKRRSKAVLFRSAPVVVSGESVAGDRVGADIEERYFENDVTDDVFSMPPCGGGTERKYCSSKAVRVVRRTFEYDSAAETANRRLKQETVCYGSATAAGSCNTGKAHTVTYSTNSTCGTPPTSACAWDADNGRHYNVETHSGTLGDASDGRTITTKWSPANWKPTFSAANPALPNLFKSRVETDAASSTTVERFYEFSTTTGFLKGVVNHDALAGRALVNCRYDEALNGTVDRDFTDISTSAITITPPETYCSRTNATFPSGFTPTSILFGKKYTYSNGQLLTAGWLKTATSTPVLMTDYTRDGATGWITASRDTAGQSTAYTYDGIGRVTSVTPPGEIAINICYKDLGNQGTTKYPTQTTVYRKSGAAACPVDPVSTLYSWEHYDYDGLGRRIRTRRMMPATSGVQVAKQFSLRDGRGNQFFSSEWVPDTTSEGGIVPTDAGASGDATNCVFSDGAFGSKRPKTALGTYSMCWDPFGRPQQVVGSRTTTLGEIKREDGTSKYSNTVELFKTYCVSGTLASSGSCTAAALGSKYDSVETTNRKDAFGRLVKVTEPTTDVTDYDYDVNGKLTLVTQAPAQTRTFTYDRLGFLRSEATPEKGSVSYDSIGSLGNVIQKTEGGIAHAYAYDYAGRLSTETAGGVRYLMNCYDGSVVNTNCPDATPNFSGGSKPKGKLSRRVGRNASYRPLWPTTPLVTMDLTDDLEYSGLGGRMSGRATALQGGANSASKETWTYTTRGLLDVHGHPRLNVPNASTDDSAFFKETYSYVAGLPTSIAVTGKKGDASSITGATLAAEYALSGGVAKVTATQSGGSAFVTTIAADTTTYLPRPSRISTSAGGFDTGSYSFDGAGNILAMNKDTNNVDLFAYDNLSRVTLSKVKALSVANDQNYEYGDRYGNLTKITTNTTVRSLGTSTLTNRLSAWNYDAMGNLTGNGTSEIYTYDALSRQVESDKSGVDWQYLFNGGDERFVRVPAAANPAVTRREMARFLVQAKGWAPATSCTESSRTFTDVHCADQDWGVIETFVANGITAGCGGTSYCPDTAVTRAQMAVFLLKAEHGSTYDPPNCTPGLFVDVTCTPNVGFPDWIEQLYDEQVTAGCQSQPLAYCPNASTTEFQMAAFLSKGPNPFGPGMWPNYHAIPGGSWYTFRNDQDQLVTEFTDSFAGRDNVFLGNLLVASYVSNVNSGVVGWNFHAADHLGTLRLTVNGANLQTIESKKYYPFGEQVGTAGTLTQKVGFAVMERDSESNRFYDHARNHDFNLGRFVSPDQIGGRGASPQSWNRYAYAANNPMKYVDPNGLDIVIAARFADGVRLSDRQQLQSARNVGQSFANAGVKNVSVTLRGVTVFRGNQSATTGVDVRTSFTVRQNDPKLDDVPPPKGPLFGATPVGSPNSRVSLTFAPDDAAGAVNFTSNVSSHETAHGANALPKNVDWFHQGVDPGSIMEGAVSAKELGDNLREFSPADAKALREFLNNDCTDGGSHKPCR